MQSVHVSIRPVLLRLLLVAAVAVSHCCLMGQTAWAAGVHDGAMSAHGAPGPATAADWHRSPMAPMICDGAHAVVAARLALPAPAPASVPVAVTVALGSLTPQPSPVYRDPPDPLPPSRATLQIFLI